MGAGVVIAHANPVADAGKRHRGIGGMDGPAGEPCGHFTLRIPDDVLVAIDGRDPGDGLA
ncbi:hypothetical protein GCM10007933_29050 [Zoogloea oryzae]|uniref:Uncharacterized protein n=1 Tax=Zoogloea oryzae TaxID=310767 RepID=A0ABQ6FDS0_9RHOO|nr:hypothetical protein GCM10007933_29050 [Zoogloea oryzae]